ncbi:RNA polymerase sigma factor [Micromonospora auratinigra]|uniref:RNA polymerase sigma-70 factor, ECF subfamily n=1 Tax=Micromonospora auratinigra TaxID=261654 RepID=A0A1A9A100_9ACTN|nr:SigE family RNA polymerase sigma factor [Micromonospora auratinigra]SBT49871.1 RNA polymerase sigma-70 factor, ECF subfamily [Micromonospora auratinigra]
MTVRQQTGPPGPVAAAPVDFTDFYRAHFHRIAVQLYAYLGDHAEAQDLTQEAFCRTLERWDRVSGYGDPSAFVRRVAWNLATSRLRRVRTAVRHLARQREEHTPGPEPDRVALTRALADLPTNQRRAIVLHHLAQLSVREIAEQVGAPEGTVRSWLSRGRTALADQFTETGSETRRA